VAEGLRQIVARLLGYVIISNPAVQSVVRSLLGVALLVGIVLGVVWAAGFVFRSGWDAAGKDAKRDADEDGEDGEADDVPF
jgi:hypothetical protein